MVPCYRISASRLLRLEKSIKVHKIQLGEVKRDGPDSLEWLFMKSHEFAKLINSNYYPHLAKIHPLSFTLGIYPLFTPIFTVFPLPLQIFGIFSAWLTGINHFIRKQIVNLIKGATFWHFLFYFIFVNLSR